MATNSALLSASVGALAPWQPRIADAIAAAAPDPRIVPIEAKDGTPSIAARERATSSSIQLHSRYEPFREAQRHVAEFDRVATLVHLGSGGLHVPRAFLDSYRAGVVLVVEPEPGVLSSVLSHIDVVPHIESGRLRFAIDESAIAEELPQLHQPTIRDGIRITRTSPWVDWEPQRSQFVQLRERLDGVTREIAGDYAGLVAFGRRWLAHTVENSLRIDWNSVSTNIARFRHRLAEGGVRVFAAGPSLDHYFAADRGNETRDERVGIIVDTAAPAFSGRRRNEYAVVILDPQGWSRLHFREHRYGGDPFPAETAVVDLGAAPLPFPDGTSVLPMGSNHPLHHLVAAAGFPLLPGTASQNVTIAAVTLATRYGRGEIEVLGADFAYPRGVTYARGTYHYRIADQRATRLSPAESFFSSMVYPACSVESVEPPTEGPVFRRPGMGETAHELAQLQRRERTADFDEIERGSKPIPDPIRFWSTHLETLEHLETRIEGIDDLSSVEILRLLGAEGRAHLPAIAAIQRLQQRKNPSECDTDPLSRRYRTIIRQIRSFIFSRLCRYSN